MQVKDHNLRMQQLRRIRLASIKKGEPDITLQNTVPLEKITMRHHSLLRTVVQKIWKRRVPVFSQMSEVECGLTCLAMLLSYYGRKTSVSEVRMQCGVGRDGLSALGIVKAARSYGMRVKALSLQHNDFSRVRLPAIIHWQFKHFVVLEKWTPDYVVVVDPAGGRRRLTAQEFDASFTGVVITMEPGAHFQRKASAAPLSISIYVRQFIRQAPGSFAQVVGASVVLQLFGLILPLLTKVVVDDILPFKLNNVMVLLGVGMLMLLCSQTVTSLLREWLLVYLRARIDVFMMQGFFKHLLSLPFSFLQQRSSGDLLTRMESNATIRDAISSQLISAALDSSMVIVYLFVLLWQSPPFALLALTLGSIQVILMVASYRPISNVAKRELTEQGKAQGYLAEALAGIETLKAMGAEHRAHERWSNLFFNQLNISIQRSCLIALVNTAVMAVRSLSPLALLWIGTMQVLNGSMSVGTMLALNTLASSFLGPLISLVNGGQQLQLAQACIERLADIMIARPEQNSQKAYAPPRLTGRIQLQNVSFRYAGDTPKVLDYINVTIEAGQKVAIVGRTGSGKSTLGKLLLGLYIPTEGSILYDGIPLQSMNYQEVRRQFGVVMQNAAIFSGSILSNITLNNPTMSKEQVFKAAMIACIHEDITKMPMAYDTFVSEGGSALSGGQRQRLAIARAVAHQPVILLLDEATSSLDVVTEQKVSQNLQRLACTQIIIAHRLSTIRDADLILVMDQGTIVERGTHDKLLRRNGYYARLVRQQLEKEELPKKSQFASLGIRKLM
jgi:ATP-binding cassette subfamily B protein